MNIKKFRDKTVISKTLILSGTKLKIFKKIREEIMILITLGDKL